MLHGKTAWAPLILRLAVGITFLSAGTLILMTVGAENFVQTVKNMGDFLPEKVAEWYGYGLPYLEIVVGALLILGLLTRFTAAATSLMLVSFIIAIGMQNLGQNFPFFMDPTAKVVPQHDFAYLAITLALIFLGPGKFALDNAIFGGEE